MNFIDVMVIALFLIAFIAVCEGIVKVIYWWVDRTE